MSFLSSNNAASLLDILNGSNPIAIDFCRRLVQFPTDICILCLYKLKTPKNGRNPCGCCDECALFAELTRTDPDFVKDTQIVLNTLAKISTEIPTGSISVRPTDGITHDVFIPHTPILSNPEKHLFFACLLVAFFRTRTNYGRAIATNDAEIICSNSLSRQLTDKYATVKERETVLSCYATPLKASFQVPIGNGVVSSFYLDDCCVKGNFYTVIQGRPDTEVVIVRVVSQLIQDDRTGEIEGIFEIVDVVEATRTSKDTDIHPALFIMSNDIKKSRAGRCVAVSHPSFAEDLVITDFAYETLLEEKKLAKQAKKEQERKEQERKEKKERKREEQRQQDIQRREQEIALRAARATLVVAVAKIDADLERINRLKELNREVALKTQKLADRKEAEALAAAAEKRHAEKLKQKELERQKFITKKI